MTFANPSYLWAFTGLLIPLAIHLLSRKEGKVIRVGSLRHVEESNTSQFKSIRLNEVLLMLLRFLMIATMVLFMSGAQCSGPSAKNTRQVYLEEGISSSSIDSLVSNGYELHSIPRGTNYWSLAEDLNKLPYDIVVVSYSKAVNFKGERVALAENIKWVTAESSSKEYPALAWKAGDSAFFRLAKSDERKTSYVTNAGVADSIEVIEPAAVKVSTDDKIVIAALNVLKEEYKLPIQISEEQETLNIKVAEGFGPLVEKVSATEIHINHPLDQDIALNENLVIELFKVLYPELQKPELNEDARVLPEKFSFSKSDKVAEARVVEGSNGIEKYLVALFLLSLAIERLVAIRRNQ